MNEWIESLSTFNRKLVIKQTTHVWVWRRIQMFGRAYLGPYILTTINNFYRFSVNKDECYAHFMFIRN